MAINSVAVIPTIGNIAARPSITISTAVLPGLIQCYCEAREVLPHFMPDPGLLLTALDDKASYDRTIFCLQQGAKALNALECLEAGDTEALSHARTLISAMAHALYRQAEKEGAA